MKNFMLIITLFIVSCASSHSKTYSATIQAEQYWEDIAPHATHVTSRNIEPDLRSYMQRIIKDNTDADAYIGVGDSIVRSVDTSNPGDWWHYDAFEPGNSYRRTKGMESDIEILMVADAFVKRGVELGGDETKANQILTNSRQVVSLMMRKTPDSFRHPRDFVKLDRGSWAFNNYSQLWKVKNWNKKVFDAVVERTLYPNGRYDGGSRGSRRGGSSRYGSSYGSSNVNVNVGRGRH